jgi:hypothetical protein
MTDLEKLKADYDAAYAAYHRAAGDAQIKGQTDD